MSAIDYFFSREADWTTILYYSTLASRATTTCTTRVEELVVGTVLVWAGCVLAAASSTKIVV